MSSRLKCLSQQFPNIPRVTLRQILQEHPTDAESYIQQEYCETKVLSREDKVSKIRNNYPYLSYGQVNNYLDHNFEDLDQAIKQIEKENNIKQTTQTPQTPLSSLTDSNNDQSSSDRTEVLTFDFHQYSVQSMKYSIDSIFQSAKSADSNVKLIKLIVGKGNHSLDGICRLRIAARKTAKEYNIHSFVDPKNSGIVIVDPKKSAYESDNPYEHDSY